MIRDSAAHLRKLLDGRIDDEALSLYNTLWTLEFKTAPLSAQEPLRDLLRNDAEKLRALDSSKRPFLLGELGQAYKILGDIAGSKWVDEQQIKTGAKRPDGAAAAINRWRGSHPPKNGSEHEAYQEMLVRQTEERSR